LKLAVAFVVFLAFLAMPARVVGQPLMASAAGERATPASASSLPAASANSPAPMEAAFAAMAPLEALPAPPSAVITLKTPPRATHRFTDATNLFALNSMAAGLTADALSTQKGLSYPGFYEMNPLARPFVKSRSGAAIYSAGSFGLLAGGMYLAHRTHHHKLERILPFAVGGWEGLLSLRNYRVISQRAR
jgi:hypothetical protein